MDASPRQTVAVVGASAAGLFAAYLLALNGRRVTVFERSPGLDPAPRTLIVTTKMRELLGQLGDASLLNEIRCFELFAGDSRAVFTLDKPDLVIERSLLIKALAKQAEDVGVRFEFGRRFTSLRVSGDSLAIRLADRNGQADEAAADVVIGADGAESRVARAAGLRMQPTVPLLQAVVALPSDLVHHTSRVWFRPHETPYFYWLIPSSPLEGALGLIAERPAQMRTQLDRFADILRVRPLEYQAARVPLYTGWKRLHRKLGSAAVYLVGDAAGHVKVTTVGGIVTGFHGVLAVVSSILNPNSGGAIRRFRFELESHRYIRKAIHHFDERDYQRLFHALSAGGSAVLGRHTRDDVTRLAWHLARSSPRLVMTAVVGLRRRFPAV